LNVENDYIGTFATVVQGTEKLIQHFENKKDIYSSMMVKTLADRLAEATAEWLHYQVRTKIWNYASDELLEIENILKNKYQGIRPAIGYPSLPDQSIIFDLEPLLQLNTIGIKITENGAMYPPSSVAGLYFAHPQSKYFNVGKIDDQQLKDYARRRGKTIEEMKKWLAANI
jgi:5-methyltetrahydrofolate--homocysteine methyltransferase